MTELEQALVALGRGLDVPAAPNLVPRVRDRLAPRRRPWRPLALALAVVALAVGVAFAIPPARSAILRFFHLGGVTIERVETLPRAQERPLAADLGRPMNHADAVRTAGFEPLVPRGVHPRLYAWPEAIAMLIRVERKPVLISEIPGDSLQYSKKYAAPGTQIIPLLVGGRPGFWITGARHVVQFQSGEPRLAGNVLLFLRRDLTVRIEGDLSRAKALEIARSLR